MNKLRILFMGTPDFALVSCKAVFETHELVGVVTQPDRPKGRGGKVSAPPVKEFALSKGLPVWQPTVLKDGSFLPVLEETKPDLIVVAAYGRILPEYILNYPKFGCINVHGSLLPRYRGAAPIQRAVINGEKETGVTIMKMAKGMDTGDMYLRRSTPIKPEDTAGSVFDRLATIGAEALLETITMLQNGTAVAVPQKEEEATYAPMIEKAEAEVDFNRPAKEVRDLIMGMNPAPGAFVDLGEYRLKLHEAYEAGAVAGLAGMVADISTKGILVVCGDGNGIWIKTIQKQGKNRTDAYSYACGAKLAVGEYLK